MIAATRRHPSGGQLDRLPGLRRCRLELKFKKQSERLELQDKVIEQRFPNSVVRVLAC
jgi:hypothetical protein